MPLQTYLISPYDHTAETRQFKRICDLMEKHCQKGKAEAILIGNYNIEGVELDALLATRHGFLILEFKNWGGHIMARENGQWLADGKTIKGGMGNKSPFTQARINRSRVSLGLQKLLGKGSMPVKAIIIFAGKSEIDDQQLSDTVKKWLTVCDDDHLPEVLAEVMEESKPLLTDQQLSSIPSLLHIKDFSEDHASTHISNDAYEPEASENLFEALETAIGEVPNYTKVYSLYNRVFQKVLDQKTNFVSFQMAGTFAKTDYLLKEHQAPRHLVRSTNDTRVRLRKHHELSQEELEEHHLLDLKNLCLFISFLYNTTIPATLVALFPTEKPRTFSPTLFSDSTRVIVEQWDDDYIYGSSEDDPEGKSIQICYSHGNTSYNYDWSYLQNLLYKGAQLNLIRVREDDKIAYPELIIFEPDYLVNISSIAHCFTNYGPTPLTDLLHKIETKGKTEAILLGNFAGQLLDEEISNQDFTYAKSITDFFKKNGISILSTGLGENFHNDAQIQKKNIHTALRNELPKELKDFDIGKGIVEPTFYSEMLGMLGRMDYLQLDFKVLMEQKSGKGEFPYDHFTTPKKKEEHYVQLLLYMCLIRYNYREAYERINRKIQAYLLYSKYLYSLLPLGFAPELVFKAIKIRNELTWHELQYARPDGFRILESLTPEVLNVKKTNDNLWNKFQQPQIEELLAPIHNASDLERAYYFRFLTFIAQEHLLSKLGNKTKENSGFASTWHNTLEEKRQSGNIYDNLTLVQPDSQTQGRVETVTLAFTETPDNDMSNFRKGDSVFLYPYPHGTTPDARKTMVFRGYLDDIKTDTISISLRFSQAENRAFLYGKDMPWAIEHDFIDSSYNYQYQGMHAFLSAPQKRRDLILLQREPEIDNTLTLKGDYGAFNDLALKVKRAKDLFLIIGPPGTGKTSFGLLNTVKEELEEAGSSILLLSFTNRAVDEICSKLKESGIDFIRIGNANNCSEDYVPFLISERVKKCKNIVELKAIIDNTRVFVGTTASINTHIDLLDVKQFTLAVVDEASQILEPYLIGLLSANKDGMPAIKKMVLIGDHKQLPAVVQQTPQISKVQDPQLREILLTDCRLSLFERLLKRYEKSEHVTYMLRHQGRMHQDIALFPNHAFYNNQLTVVPLPHQRQNLATIGKGKDGIIDLLLTRRIAFVASEQPHGTSSPKVNMVEAEIIAATVERIYKIEKEQFNPTTTVGVIVPYRNQIATVRNTISRLDLPEEDIDTLRDITIDTVERFQGSQRKYIIYGFTIQQYDQLDFLTSNVFEDTDGNIVDRKLNVAMTRATHHLVMTGNPELLSNNFTFFKLMEWVRSKHSFFKLKKDDYVAGHFTVPEYNATNLDLSKATFTTSGAFEKAFEEHVMKPIKAGATADMPSFIFGRDMDTNMNAICYGRSNITGDILMHDGELSKEHQVLLYSYYYLRPHYCSFRIILDSYKDWLLPTIHSFGDRLQIIDMGCGPATCGMAFCERFLAETPQMAYTGIDISSAMTQKGAQLLDSISNGRLRYQMTNSFSALKPSFWKGCSELPTLIIFSFSYFFSNVTAQYTEQLARQIIDVMRKHTLNQYVFIIQQSEHDNGINAYRVFRRMMNPHMEEVKREDATLSYLLNDKTCTQSFNYEILTSKR